MAAPPEGPENEGNFHGSTIVTTTHQGSVTDLTYDEDEESPTHLFSILEKAVPRGNEEADIHHRRDMVEHTWYLVRRWLWTHLNTEDRRAAAYIRGQANATPLHLMCKLKNPPAELMKDIIDAAPEVATWTDTHGWLPLHHACANGASPEVIRVLLDAYPDGKIAQDSLNRTPLHFFVTRSSDAPKAMVENAEMLCEGGAAELTDRGSMLPMHYACAYGTIPEVLQVLANAYPDSLRAKEQKGRTPLHLAMVNAHRDTSPGVIKFLLEGKGSATVNRRDNDGFLPLHLLAKGLENLRADNQTQRSNVSDCLKMYLSAGPAADVDFFAALQDLPDWLQDTAVVSLHVRSILNKKIIQRFPTSILLLDGYFLMMLIVAFEVASKDHITLRRKLESNATNITDALANAISTNCTLGLGNNMDVPCVPDWPVNALFWGAGYFFTRELVQVLSLISLGGLRTWFTDPTNYLDVAVIFSVTYNAIMMENPDFGVSTPSFQSYCVFTKAILWLAVIYYLKSINVQFAVFVGGVYYVLRRLVAFLIAVIIILLTFAQMFFIIYRRTALCNDQSASSCGHQYPHCSFYYSLFRVYAMMMGNINAENRYYGLLEAQLVYVAYAFVVPLLMSNVLIAIVIDLYEVIQNDRAAIVFWSNRLDFVAEMDAM